MRLSESELDPIVTSGIELDVLPPAIADSTGNTYTRIQWKLVRSGGKHENRDVLQILTYLPHLQPRLL